MIKIKGFENRGKYSYADFKDYRIRLSGTTKKLIFEILDKEKSVVYKRTITYGKLYDEMKILEAIL